jgi:glutaminyl-tRNA synthetase
MASPNINMRDPALYRIRRAHHDRTGDKWCIYPMYDFTHCLSDAIEGITHSLCSLEFQDHRPLYDWVIDEVGIECHPQQIEFARLNLSYTVMSKRKLRQLVEENIVNGWDDPRMPTISGMRRRGYPAQAIRNFCDRIGLAKRENTIELALLEFCVRESLNKTANRHMAVFNPVKLVITNYPEGESETLEAINNPEDEAAGKRTIPFSRELYIERDDFMEDAPKKFFRMAPGREVRLRYAYLVTCQSVVKDDAGEITEIHCTYDPETKGGNAPDGRKVKSTIHWVSAEHAVDAEIRNYELLFTEESPEAKENFLDCANKDSLNISSAKVEPYVSTIENKGTLQFERIGYYAFDPDSQSDKLVFNRTVPLRDPWKKAKGK